LLTAVAGLVAAGAQPAAVAAGDITGDVLARRNVRLSGDASITVPAGTTTYGGVISGEGTLRVRGRGTLVLTKDSDFTVPKAQQRQSVRMLGGNHPYVVVGTPDPPAVIVDRGATLQYGNGGTTGVIGRFPRLVEVALPEAGNTWAPEAVWDPEQDAYLVHWSSTQHDNPGHEGESYNRIMSSTTRDFREFSEPRVWIDRGWQTIDATVIEHDGAYYRFLKDERSRSGEAPLGKSIFSEPH
jgi:hypothetical protein